MGDAACVELLRWALPKLHLRWAGYRRVRGRVCRRIRRRMRELGIADASACRDYRDYRAHLEHHPEEWQRLDALCRIPISRFFRDRALFSALETRVLPALAERARADGRRTLRAWSAGCASGEEPYSLALLWRSALAARFPDLRLEIVATDADRGVLARAHRACFHASSLKEVPAALRADGFERRGDLYCLRPELREGVELRCQDIRVGQPAGVFDLVLCRNLVFTYFDAGLQGELLGRIVERLRPGGALAIGLHESLPGAAGLVPWPGARCVHERREGPGDALPVGPGGATASRRTAAGEPTITLFLCGDVMTGRGIDQVLPHPGRPDLFEPALDSALGYVQLAEAATGPIPRPVDFAYIWGDAPAELARAGADVRIVNLETAVTVADDASPEKRIHYRMHPANVACLAAAGIDCCVLANNHVLDWGRGGLAETLETLHETGIRTAGAGRDRAAAEAPAILEVPGAGRVLVFAFCTGDSGVPAGWAARADRPGVSRLADLSAKTAEALALRIRAARRPGDVVVTSVHWGGNWGFEIPGEQRSFARKLIDLAGVDVVHGHSSHHVKGIEVHRDRPIVYGCGDFLDDYEGIGGHQRFRGELGLMYFPQLDARSGRLLRFVLTPTRVRRFRVERAPAEGVGWLLEVLNREGRSLGTHVERRADDTLLLHWR